MSIDTSTIAGSAVALEDRYPTLDEVIDAAQVMAARHPKLCGLRGVATSRAGQPLTVLSVGHGPAHALVVAGAHANEAVGGATIVELAQRAIADPVVRRDTTWHFLLCLDPDGVRLAEGACRAPRTLYGQHRDFFRPTAEEQPEWAPAMGARLPETAALAALIDELQPFLQCSLHSTDVGGTFLQATRDIPGLADAFAKSAADLGIPVEIGPYDTVGWPSPAPGLFLMPPSADAAPGTADDVNLGASTWYAPCRHGGATLIVEVPVWLSERLSDPTPITDPQGDLMAAADQIRHRGALLADLLASAGPHPSPDRDIFLRALRMLLSVCVSLADEWDPRTPNPHPPPALMPNRGTLAGVELWAHRIPLRAAALLRRATDPVNAPAERLGSRVDPLLREWCAEYQHRFPATDLPVASQVEHQVRTVRAAVALSRPE